MDWMTLTIELMGLAILLIWTVIPLQEFRTIFTHLRSKPPLADPQGGFEVKSIDPTNPGGESH
jgi:hypothetical protein